MIDGGFFITASCVAASGVLENNANKQQKKVKHNMVLNCLHIVTQVCCVATLTPLAGPSVSLRNKLLLLFAKRLQWIFRQKNKKVSGATRLLSLTDTWVAQCKKCGESTESYYVGFL